MERWRSIAAMEIETAPFFIARLPTFFLHSHSSSSSSSSSSGCGGASSRKPLPRKQHKACYVSIWSSCKLLHSSCLRLRVLCASGRRVSFGFSTSLFVRSLILLNVNHGNLLRNPIRAKSESGTAAELEPRQKIGNKGKGHGKVQERSISRSKYQTGSLKSQDDRVMLENGDDEGSAQGFAVLAALKARLLQNPATSESLSKYGHPGSHVQDRTTSNQEGFKLPSSIYSKNNSKSLSEEVSTNLPRKVSDSDIESKPFPELPSDGRVFSEAKIQIYLSNLPTQLTTKEFNTIMQNVPGLSSWKLMVNKKGSCRGYGFCDVNLHSDGKLAIELLSRMSIHGKPIFVKFSDSGTSRPNYAQQSVKNNNSILVSDLLNPSNTNKEQAQWTTENQMAIGTQPLMEDKRLSRVRRALSKEVHIVDQTSKAPPQAIQNVKAQTANGSSSMGESILEAIKKAAIERSKSSRRSKKASRRERKIIDNDLERDGNHHVGEVKPISIKPEWASELKCLEASLAGLKKFL